MTRLETWRLLKFKNCCVKTTNTIIYVKNILYVSFLLPILISTLSICIDLFLINSISYFNKRRNLAIKI